MSFSSIGRPRRGMPRPYPPTMSDWPTPLMMIVTIML
jgi:hypothetical protein